MDSLYLVVPHYFHSTAYPDFPGKRFNGVGSSLHIFPMRISQRNPKFVDKQLVQNWRKHLYSLGCINGHFLFEGDPTASAASEGSGLFSTRAFESTEVFRRPDSCLQYLFGKAQIFYKRLCEAHIEDVRGILESTRDEIQLSDLRSIIERFDEDSDWMKSLVIFQWAREQRIFQPEETDAEIEEENGYELQKEEVRIITIEFLRSLGLSMGFSTRLTKKSGKFMAHLHSIVLNRYSARFAEGGKISALEIREILLPYLDALAAKHEDELINMLVHFPDPPPLRAGKMADNRYLASSERQSNVASRSDVKRDGSGNCGLMFNGNFRPSVSYALSLGLSLEQVQSIANRYPRFLSLSPEIRIKPIVSYFLALGVTKGVVTKILLKRPQLFGCSLEERLKPTMVYLESIGVDRSQWPGMLEQYPIIFTCEKDQIQKMVDFLHSIGFSATDVRRALSRFPHLVSYSIEHKLQPMVVFLRSIIGRKADIEALLRSAPQALGYSIDGNVKPALRFLIEIGYGEVEVVSMIKSYPEILGLAVRTDTKPKWEYYVETGRPKSHLVRFPQYFGYSLEATIKPRFAELLKLKHGSCWTLRRILSSSDKEFERLLRTEMARE